MFRSSVAAFYALPRCLFYGIGGFRYGGFSIVLVRPSVLCEVKKIVYRMPQIFVCSRDSVP
jgi:hypothetical protein